MLQHLFLFYLSPSISVFLSNFPSRRGLNANEKSLLHFKEGDANELVLGTSIGFNLDQQSNGSHIYLPYHNGDGMIRKLALQTNKKSLDEFGSLVFWFL